MATVGGVEKNGDSQARLRLRGAGGDVFSHKIGKGKGHPTKEKKQAETITSVKRRERT